MKFKYLLKTLILSLFFILVSGLYAVYDIFYSSYFDQLTFKQNAWIVSSAPPTEQEILFSGFTNINTIIGSILISTLILELLKRLKGGKVKLKKKK